jgi:ArsR family transcriptional regulator, arsenate/arsenite/antimonite-responsive transcriptional repressor
MNATLVSTNLLMFLKSLASESRLSIVLLFLDGQERTVNQIAESITLGQPATSEHLMILKQSGVLLSRKEGKENYYRPDREKILAYIGNLSDLLQSCCK